MPHGALSAWLEWPPTTAPRGVRLDVGDAWHVPPTRRREMAAFLGPTSFDAFALDTAVLPLDKMTEIKTACKLDVVDPTDSSGPSKIFHDNLQSASSCAQKIGSNLLSASLGEGAGTRFKGELEVELGSQEHEDMQAMQDTCHDFASILLHRLSRKANREISRVDAARVLKAYGRCLESLGQGTTLMGCQMGDVAHGGGEDEALCEVEEGAEENASSWF
ncbi:unnamed protein product [Effrenium voratum]|nr:unnamed protein product [Effrenium voratum]